MRLMALNAAALRHGLEPGMALAQAQAMLPDLIVRPHDPDADGRLLETLADWADRYTPLVGRTPPDGLMLDITGAAHLCGGEAQLQTDLVRRLDAQGFATRTAIAPTPGAAFALARYGPLDTDSRGPIVDAGGLREAIAPLPIAGLRLDAATVAGLRRSGLRTIGDLMSRPRAPLTARFGGMLTHRLDQALGIDGEAISPRRPIPPAEVTLPLAEPILREEDVSEAARRLCVSLCALLVERGEGARHLLLSVSRVDGIVRRVEVGVAEPSTDPNALHSLLALRLGSLEDPLEAGYGFDFVRLAATITGPHAAEAVVLPGTTAAVADDTGRLVSRLADRLAARFGREQVLTVATADTHLPEMADVLVARSNGARSNGARSNGASPRIEKSVPATAQLSPFEVAFEGMGPLRPLRLFEPPEPVEIMAAVPDGPPLRLRWRRQSLGITAAEGPERIAAAWWVAGTQKGPGNARDYYRVVDETGRRLWIFRDGLFGGTTLPRWYVHGLFA
jgi:protein ImuB